MVKALIHGGQPGLLLAEYPIVPQGRARRLAGDRARFATFASDLPMPVPPRVRADPVQAPRRQSFADRTSSVATRLCDVGHGRRVIAVYKRLVLVGGAMTVGLLLAGCGSGSSSPTTTSTSSSATTAPARTATTAAVPTTAAATTSAATCPTLAQANTALGGSFGGPISTPTAGGGIVCEYTSGVGNAGVTIFAHQSATVFAGQVAHAPGAPAMPSIAGVGNGAFGATTAGRSIVNAYSNRTRTLVAAQAPGALSPVEALAKVALADN